MGLVSRGTRLEKAADRVSQGSVISCWIALDGFGKYRTGLGFEDGGAGAFAVKAEEAHGVSGVKESTNDH